MNDQVWHSGPPPSVGWWPASTSGWAGVVRWWDGEHWSAPASPGTAESQIERVAATRARTNQIVCWTHRPTTWPARSLT